ncbi:uncharacterized protein LOC128249525 [Octopus bimaculoides]|uniref:uncharacterized protein LOC128249525 n=1 Tax=Octopus bimaculoides TaxID=37653 RepID=UPI0022E97632|nr:uncharacterized protein LOC128249525 [Octopus bimaculoides]
MNLSQVGFNDEDILDEEQFYERRLLPLAASTPQDSGEESYNEAKRPELEGDASISSQSLGATATEVLDRIAKQKTSTHRGFDVWEQLMEQRDSSHPYRSGDLSRSQLLLRDDEIPSVEYPRGKPEPSRTSSYRHSQSLAPVRLSSIATAYQEPGQDLMDLPPETEESIRDKTRSRSGEPPPDSEEDDRQRNLQQGDAKPGQDLMDLPPETEESIRDKTRSRSGEPPPDSEEDDRQRNLQQGDASISSKSRSGETSQGAAATETLDRIAKQKASTHHGLDVWEQLMEQRDSSHPYRSGDLSRSQLLFREDEIPSVEYSRGQPELSRTSSYRHSQSLAPGRLSSISSVYEEPGQDLMDLPPETEESIRDKTRSRSGEPPPDSGEDDRQRNLQQGDASRTSSYRHSQSLTPVRLSSVSSEEPGQDLMDLPPEIKESIRDETRSRSGELLPGATASVSPVKYDEQMSVIEGEMDRLNEMRSVIEEEIDILDERRSITEKTIDRLDEERSVTEEEIDRLDEVRSAIGTEIDRLDEIRSVTEEDFEIMDEMRSFTLLFNCSLKNDFLVFFNVEQQKKVNGSIHHVVDT